MSARRKLTLAAVGAAMAASLAFIPVSRAVEAGPEIIVFRTPTCSCCDGWAGTLEQAGFRVRVVDARNIESVREDAGVPVALRSCHTARVGHYIIEGHVPAADIERLLKQEPRVAGLAVAGMPAGSPGMEGPSPQHYTVLSFTRAGAERVFARH